MADDLAALGRQCTYDAYSQTNVPHVRAKDNDNNILEIEDWLVRVWDGEIYGSNDKIERLDDEQRKDLSNVRHWQLYDDIMFAEFNAWLGVKDETTEVYPKLDHMVYRYKKVGHLSVPWFNRELFSGFLLWILAFKHAQLVALDKSIAKHQVERRSKYIREQLNIVK